MQWRPASLWQHCVCAQTQELDSLRVINLQEVEVISTRATSSTPVAFTNIGKEQLKNRISDKTCHIY